MTTMFRSRPATEASRPAAPPPRSVHVLSWALAAAATAAAAATYAFGGVPATVDDRAADLLDGTGASMVSTYLQDLAFWLPLLAVGAVWLWQRKPWGFLLGGAALTMWTVESFTVAVDQWFGHRADPASTVASGGAVVPFSVAGVVGVAMAVAFFRHVHDVDH